MKYGSVVFSFLILFFGNVVAAQDPIEYAGTELFKFEVNGNEIVGILDTPTAVDPTATVVIVHGYGKTNVVADNWYAGLRSRLALIGVSTLVWDKPGCGLSEGEFDINQPVQSSADEVLAAIRALQKTDAKGTANIGLWGISRAGWIAPLALTKDPSIAFWISLSGTDAQENARYLLESNFPIEGRSTEETERLVAEWQNSFNTLWQNGTYEQYLESSPTLRSDPFMILMNWDGQMSKAAFEASQK